MTGSSTVAPTSSAAVVGAHDPAWRAHVLDHDEALPFHHPSWSDVITDTYGYEPFALVVRSPAGDVLGGVPFVSVGGKLRRERWVSLPFTDSCPPLTSSDLPLERLGSIVGELQSRGAVSQVEIRAPLEGSAGAPSQHGVVHTLALSDPDSLFRAFTPQVRRNIRKAEASGLAIRPAEQREDLTRVYYGLHAETRRRLGVPTQPRRFFDSLWNRMVEPNLAFVLLAYHGDEAVAGAVFLHWNGTIVYKFGASDERHWPLRPNNLIFWECIRRGCETGAHTLDFGRSDADAEGLRAFKRSWGAIEDPLAYTTFGKAAEAGAHSESAGRLLRPVIRAAPAWFGRGLGEFFYRFAA